MNNYRLILDTKSKKFLCPECNKRTFVKYIDTTTGEYLPDNYGRCDREIKCSYFLNPYEDGYSKAIWEQGNGNPTKPDFPANFYKKQATGYRAQPKQRIKALSFIPYEILAATRKGYEQNTFIQNLLHRVKFPFDAKDIEQVIKMYHLGTICKGYRSGAITFPFIDIKGQVRAIQAKQFDNLNHTLKDGTGFIHTLLKKHYENENKPLPDWLKSYLGNEIKVSCLFGEHLITKYPANPIALIEAPKTAIIGTLYFGLPDNPKNFLWLGVYNLSSLNIEKCKVLQGRKVVLFPDLNAYDNWSSKAREFEKESPGTTFKVSDLIESLAPNESKNKGEDIADFLTRMDWKAFRKLEKISATEPPTKYFTFPEPITNFKSGKPGQHKAKPVQTKQRETWVNQIEELEQYFSSCNLPACPIKLKQGEMITNVAGFVKSHISTIKTNNGNHYFLTYLERLQLLKTIIEH